MKANEIKKGEKYIAKVSGVLTTVRVDEIREVSRGRMAAGGYTYGTATVYDVTNLKTGRKTTFRSAAKFRREVVERPSAELSADGLKMANSLGVPPHIFRGDGVKQKPLVDDGGMILPDGNWIG